MKTSKKFWTDYGIMSFFFSSIGAIIVITNIYVMIPKFIFHIEQKSIIIEPTFEITRKKILFKAKYYNEYLKDSVQLNFEVSNYDYFNIYKNQKEFIIGYVPYYSQRPFLLDYTAPKRGFNIKLMLVILVTFFTIRGFRSFLKGSEQKNSN